MDELIVRVFITNSGEFGDKFTEHLARELKVSKVSVVAAIKSYSKEIFSHSDDMIERLKGEIQNPKVSTFTKEVPQTKSVTSSPSSPTVFIEKYSKKSFIVGGDTITLKEILRDFGGLWRPVLGDFSKVWLFAESKTNVNDLKARLEKKGATVNMNVNMGEKAPESPNFKIILTKDGYHYSPTHQLLFEKKNGCKFGLYCVGFRESSEDKTILMLSKEEVRKLEKWGIKYDKESVDVEENSDDSEGESDEE